LVKDKGEEYYVAECFDLPVVTQGKTLDEVVENVREAISLHLEGENLEEWEPKRIVSIRPMRTLEARISPLKREECQLSLKSDEGGGFSAA